MSVAVKFPSAKLEKISRCGLNVDASSYVDPNGFLFHLNDQIYRAIHPHIESFYRQLFDNGMVSKLINQFGLVPSTPVTLNLPQLNNKLIIQHEKIKPITFCGEWCPAMLQDAAQHTLLLSLELTEHDLMLQDAYPWNIIFQGTKPVFVDFTSIVAVDKNYIWPAYPQYQAFFQYPLALCGMQKDKISRLYLLDNINGMSLNDFYSHTSWFYRFRHPATVFTYYANNLIQKNYKLKQKAHAIAEKGITVSKEVRRRFLKRLIKQNNNLRFKLSGDVWEHYYRDIPPDVDKNKKIQVVQQLLARINPQTVTDLGCNTGVFSILAAKQGATVIAIDSSSACISALYKTAKHEKLSITPIISDVICTTPPYGIMGQQYPSLIERAKSDVVLCLGLMHHLHIIGRQPFEHIAQLLAAFCRKFVIFEYVDPKDDNIKLLTVKQAIDYDLGVVKEKLQEKFSSIEQFDSDRSSRKFLLCTL